MVDTFRRSEQRLKGENVDAPSNRSVTQSPRMAWLSGASYGALGGHVRRRGFNSDANCRKRSAEEQQESANQHNKRRVGAFGNGVNRVRHGGGRGGETGARR